jgi:hypothetical protein
MDYVSFLIYLKLDASVRYLMIKLIVIWPDVVYLSYCWVHSLRSSIPLCNFHGFSTCHEFLLWYSELRYRPYYAGKAGFSGWGCIFIEGSVAIVLRLLGFELIVNFPDKVESLMEDQRAIVMGRLNADRGDAEDDHITLKKVGIHLKDWKMKYLSFVYVCDTLPCHGTSYLISVIFRDSVTASVLRNY